MKNFKRIAAMLVAGASILPFAACGGKSDEGYSLKTVRVGDGYAVSISGCGLTYSTEGGACGVRFDKNEFRADEPVYAQYASVTETADGLVGKGSVSSPFGTVVGFEDYYTLRENEVAVDRVFTVLEAGEDYGFMTELKLTDGAEGAILKSDWLIPSTHYVTGRHGFSETSTRMFFNGKSLTVPADDVSVLTVARYKDGNYFSMTDVTAGFRENTVNDNDSVNSSLCIDEGINTPGIYIGEENGRVSLSHLYPTFVNRKADIYTYRMLPVEKGLTRTVGFVLRAGKAAGYPEMLKTCWRDAYGRFGYADKRYAADLVYDTLIDALDRSYSERTIWGEIPMYMTNTDHFFPDSGFLYRNIEFATLMLKEGRARKDEGMVAEAKKVIENQLANDRLDTGISAYRPDNSVYKRVLFDGLEGAVRLYAYEYGSGEGDGAFLQTLLDYILDKAEKYRDEESAMALSFYTALWRNAEITFSDYSDVALRLLEKAYADTEDYYGYYGGVESTNTLISVAEDYMILLRAFLDAYELDGGSKWLDKAVELGDYLETYQMIQPFTLALDGATGAEGYYLAFIGNERFLGYGYIYNNTQHGILDIANASSVVDFYRLYRHTNDGHYLQFAEDKLYNTLSYINMGDKVGYMDDPVHSAGKGFMNEFVGNATTNTGFVEAGIRGAAHDSNLGWNVWQILSTFDWFRTNCGGYLPEEMNAELTHDLAKNKYVSGEGSSPAHSPAKAVDGSEESDWIPSGDKTAVIDLNEICDAEKIVLTACGEGAAASVSFSVDGSVYGEETPLSFQGREGSVLVQARARFVKVRMQNDTGVSRISVFGSPVFYRNLAVGAAVLSSSGQRAENCLDESNYATVWNAGSGNGELILDLGAEYAIYQTALKLNAVTECAYRIEISSDGETYLPYAENAGEEAKFVFVDQKYATARYLKLILSGSGNGNLAVCDFKVMGNTVGRQTD